ncbi:FtsX-like permease family protein [Fulvivirga lutea]|uniref:ABC transporter permease n=1 Tax=Fulvivirga lutea TaxID=2810512 RepID=A0A974WL69_9BACT|nr:FtsX-like permease family protein [Fulvivirga lutea]QSE99272.1 ABC transporter permease [Fulvivirga lutea]
MKSTINNSPTFLIQNYLKVALRNLLRNKSYTAINVIGLAISICSALLILLFVQYQLVYDKHFPKSENIVRITSKIKSANTDDINHLTYTPGLWGPELTREFKNIESYTRFFKYRADIIINYEKEDKQFFEGQFFWTDPTVFDVFGFKLKNGNISEALVRPNTVVIDENIAFKYFGDSNPIGEVINYVNGDSSIPLEITGIMPSVPEQSHFHPHFFASLSTIADEWWIQDYDRMDSWSTPFWITYLRVNNNKDPRLEEMVNEYLDLKLQQDSSRYTAYLQNIHDIHLKSNLAGEFEDNGDVKSLYILSSIAFLILLIACFNFMNLATAQASQRTKEIGIRKALGSSREQLIGQFIGESLLLAIVSFIFGVIGVEVLLPYLNEFAGTHIANSYLQNDWFWGYSTILILFVGILAGSYPAFYLSSFSPLNVLKNNLSGVFKGELFRQILVVGQFTIAVLLLIGTIVITDQLAFVKNKPLGFKQDYIITIPLRGDGLQSQYSRLKRELNIHPNIASVSASSAIIMQGRHSAPISLPDIRPDDPVNWEFLNVDHTYPETINIELLSGRFFDENRASDSSAAILNEAAVKALGMTNESILGTRIQNGWGTDGKVIGVVKDFHYATLHQDIKPFALLLNYEFGVRFINIKIVNNDIQGSISHIQKLWEKYSPGTPFNYSFLDDNIDQLYKTEEKEGKLITYFTSVCMIISCLGLFGLASFMVDRRIKEIGIRKVLGATVQQVMLLLSFAFLKQVLIGFVIGAILAWLVMDYWLNEFAYRINLNVSIFLISGLITSFIALLTVGWKTLKAAHTNPANTLRQE